MALSNRETMHQERKLLLCLQIMSGILLTRIWMKSLKKLPVQLMTWFHRLQTLAHRLYHLPVPVQQLKKGRLKVKQLMTFYTYPAETLKF